MPGKTLKAKHLTAPMYTYTVPQKYFRFFFFLFLKIQCNPKKKNRSFSAIGFLFFLYMYTGWDAAADNVYFKYYYFVLIYMIMLLAPFFLRWGFSIFIDCER